MAILSEDDPCARLIMRHRIIQGFSNSTAKGILMKRSSLWLVVRLLVWLVILPLVAAAQAQRSKIILDTDIGDDIDDAWAMGFVISYEGFAPLGITITHGNTPARA